MTLYDSFILVCLLEYALSYASALVAYGVLVVVLEVFLRRSCVFDS